MSGLSEHVNSQATHGSIADLALPEEREKLGLDAVNKRGEQEGELTWGEVHSFCTNLHKNGVSGGMSLST